MDPIIGIRRPGMIALIGMTNFNHSMAVKCKCSVLLEMLISSLAIVVLEMCLKMSPLTCTRATSMASSSVYQVCMNVNDLLGSFVMFIRRNRNKGVMQQLWIN